MLEPAQHWQVLTTLHRAESRRFSAGRRRLLYHLGLVRSLDLRTRRSWIGWGRSLLLLREVGVTL